MSQDHATALQPGDTMKLSQKKKVVKLTAALFICLFFGLFFRDFSFLWCPFSLVWFQYDVFI